MRLWSIHPRYLDVKGLVGVWREGLLAQKVLQGKTVGYKNHPQLERFKQTRDPIGSIADYLRYLADEADDRGYKFDKSKISSNSCKGKIVITSGQIEYEFKHLLNKLKKRSPELYSHLSTINQINVHPKFEMINGDIAIWEII